METIENTIPPPAADLEKPFKLLISNLDWNNYVGRIAIGRITNGSVSPGDKVVCIDKDGRHESKTVTKIFTFDGLGSSESDRAGAGDIVGIAGFENVHIGETLCNSDDLEPIPFIDLDPPTMRMQLAVNDGPLSGRDGKFLTARHIQDRLIKETRTNISLELTKSEIPNTFTICARGVLQVAVLVETMRREGYELLVAKPEVIYKFREGKKTEPFETLWLEVPNESLGDVLQDLAYRKARVQHMEHVDAVVMLEAIIPSRGLIGLETFLANKSAGQAIMSHMFKEYDDFCGDINTRTSGVLVSMQNGVSTGYALAALQDRGKLFVGPQENIYAGMIVGENSRPDDLTVNPTKAKQLTNFRCQGEGKGIQLEPAIKMSLEKTIEFIANDEYIEVTPNHLRLRKKILDETQRKRVVA